VEDKIYIFKNTPCFLSESYLRIFKATHKVSSVANGLFLWPGENDYVGRKGYLLFRNNFGELNQITLLLSNSEQKPQLSKIKIQN
jgi:hypothetical protein